MIQWLRYVSHAEVESFKAQGWVLSNDLKGTHHGVFSVIMVWTGQGVPEGGKG